MPRLIRYPPVTLHLGAHRTASSALQRLLDREAARLSRAGLAVWTPRRTRSGLLTGLLGDPGRQVPRRDRAATRAAGRVAMLRQEMTAQGRTRLIISEENALGGLRENILLARLYPTVAPRLERLEDALPGIDRICLAVRPQAEWWTSAFAFLMTRGFAPPDAVTLQAVAGSRRGWRHVIEDIARAVPRARITVWRHGPRGLDPAGAFAELTGRPAPPGPPRRLNASLPLSVLRDRLQAEGCFEALPGRDDRYDPFPEALRARLDAAWAEDQDWLRDGASGLAAYKDSAEDADAAEGEDATHDRRSRRDRIRSPGPLDRNGEGRVEGPRA